MPTIWYLPMCCDLSSAAASFGHAFQSPGYSDWQTGQYTAPSYSLRVYDACVRSIWVACVLFASIRLASADARQDRQRAELVCAAHDPSCDWLATLSSLE